MELSSEHRQIRDFIQQQTEVFTLSLLRDVAKLYPQIPKWEIALTIAGELQLEAFAYLSTVLGPEDTAKTLSAFINARLAQHHGTDADGISTFLQQTQRQA